MEIDKTQEKSVEASEDYDLIKVRALITCPNGDYNKKFRNQFLRKDMRLLIPQLKVFDWLTCAACGELLDLNLEFNI
ncbi:hypothetical protein LCGC14_2150640 [marine sediment metagenome]|uniref:Uncharacterized protein n=1 Tax=marine sediment metagenome TaxID=412755 RepID=A0A0F9GS07_9ZZZZ